MAKKAIDSKISEGKKRLNVLLDNVYFSKLKENWMLYYSLVYFNILR